LKPGGTPWPLPKEEPPPLQGTALLTGGTPKAACMTTMTVQGADPPPAIGEDTAFTLDLATSGTFIVSSSYFLQYIFLNIILLLKPCSPNAIILLF
jgi:hypothetical protein